MATPATSAQIEWQSPALTFALWRSVAVAFWRLPVNTTDLSAISPGIEQYLASASPRSMGVVMVLTPDSQASFDAAARTANVEMLTRVKPYIRVATAAVEGDSLQASAFRSVASLLNLASGMPVKICPSVQAASVIVAQGMGDMDPAQLAMVVESLRKL